MQLSKFNKEQIEAITHGDGPLLIIAGAGTGKTTVITERIKYLILEKKLKPEQILALTFTEKAASEMEERIDKIMPYGYSFLSISTFHSFCDRFLKDEGINMGINPNYKLMTEADSALFLRKNIFKFNLSYFRPLGNPIKFIEALLQHFSRLKDEDISPKEYIHWAQSQKSKVKSQKLEDEDEIKKTLELAGTFEKFEELKIKEGAMDFSDLISNALRILRERKNILKKYQDQFKYILIDEFQDTNYAQNELGILFAGNKKNVTVVADDDQAIYRWRGAALSNVIQFKNNFPGTKIITLTKNYRSSQEILDRAYDLIQHNNPNRLEMLENVNKKLVTNRKTKETAIEFIHTRRVDQEAEAIAKKIKEILKKENYKYSDFAILIRANSHSQPITQALARNKIPYQFLGPGQLFQKEEIKDLIAYLKVLYDLSDSISLFRVLNMDIFNLSGRDINHLISLTRRKNLTLLEVMEKVEETYLKNEVKEQVKKIYQMIMRHMERVKKDSAGQILYFFLTDTGLFNKYIASNSAAEEQTAQNVAKFFDRIKTYESINTDGSVYAIIDWIDLMMEMGDSPLIAELDWKDYNAVNILTVHSSKGLEFPVVFMANLVSDRFPTRERKEKIPLPSSLIKEIIPEGDYHTQEERRLFYVGMTRAKDLLFFTASDFYSETKREKKISPFVYEALPYELKKKEKEQKEPTQLSLIEMTKNYEPQIADSKTDNNKTTFTHKITYLSYTHLQAFDICPLHYKARYILNLPTLPSAALSFGISIHETLQGLYGNLKQGKILSQEDLILLLKSSWRPEGYQSKIHEQEMFKKGEGILKEYILKHFDPNKTPLSLEVPFSFNISRNREAKNPDPDSFIRITGKMDRIDKLEKDAIEIIDYKTGKANGNSKYSYQLQLGMYALAATRIESQYFRKKPEDITVTLFYVEEGEKISKTVTAKELQEVEEKILDKIHQIETSNFACSKNILCANCEYKILCNTQ
ncbi:MAG: hypothetical protein A2857_02920 [Candidatus Levybacteria bacterium RIFCSPHIGHO2_01_FULL_36_15]|nr:MAG: hypothetical protein A2857_02920 [Candidatus Levybacteria bacterium RIFCSPHIGHO2_01_FULL_36_15]OGH38743.1 MAG: hypothetical protein A2905_06765 [Candidatus Levybacteria bacterium RIFCSPLOWO2_01_FULL_36_10]